MKFICNIDDVFNLMSKKMFQKFLKIYKYLKIKLKKMKKSTHVKEDRLLEVDILIFYIEFSCVVIKVVLLILFIKFVINHFSYSKTTKK